MVRFAELKGRQQTAKTPIRDVITHHWKEILLGAGCRMSENSVFYLFATHDLAYGESVLDIPRSTTLAGVNTAAAIACCTIPLFGIHSDITSRKAVYVAGNLLLIVLAFPYYAILATRSPSGIMFATIVMLGLVHPILYAVQAALISELFPTGVRYTGAWLA